MWRTPYQVPRANAPRERFLGGARRAGLEYLLILHNRHLSHVLGAYIAYVNGERPHQRVNQAIPAQLLSSWLCGQERESAAVALDMQDVAPAAA